MAGWKVEVTGLRQVYDALAEVDKKAAQAINREITGAGKAVAANAAARVSDTPLSGWGSWFSSRGGRDLGFAPSAVASGFKLRRNNFRRRGVSAGIAWDVYQTNPGGAIFEVIGDESRVGQTDFDWQGAGFVRRIRGRFPNKQPRTLIPAYYSVMSEDLRNRIRDQILAEARKAGLT